MISPRSASWGDPQTGEGGAHFLRLIQRSGGAPGSPVPREPPGLRGKKVAFSEEVGSNLEHHWISTTPTSHGAVSALFVAFEATHEDRLMSVKGALSLSNEIRKRSGKIYIFYNLGNVRADRID